MSYDDLPKRLADAIATRTAISPDAEGLTVEHAYELQDELIALLGRPVAAAKLGLTSVVKQQQMNVDEPAYGFLLAGSQIGPGEELACSELIQPRCEPEIAFVLNRDLEGPDVSATDVLLATEAVFPAIDVLDSRYAGYKFTLPSVVADNISCARYVLGDPVPLRDIDLRLVGCVFEVDGKLVGTATGAAILEHPAAALAWFVRSLAARGRKLAAGTVTLAGAMTAAVPVSSGSVVRVTIDRIGTVEVRCGP